MGTKRIKISDGIRQAAKAYTATSRNVLCRELDIDKGLFSRFLAGTSGLSMSNLDALADLLDLHIVAGRGKARRTPAANVSAKVKTRKGKVTK
jgi:hypothetical protein